MIDPGLIRSCRAASKLLAEDRALFPNLQMVGWGYKYENGKRTEKIVPVVGVTEKLTAGQIQSRSLRAIPSTIDGLPTDVKTVGIFTAPREPKEAVVQEFTQRRRPALGGDSCGHRDITAGTLGAWVRRGQDDTHVILSNAHVLSNVNRASIGDYIYQPGPFDDGLELANRIAKLEEFVRIHFSDPGGGDGGGDKGPKKDGLARKWFGFWAGIANFPARLNHCPRRLVYEPNVTVRRRTGQALEQPYPNLVDTAAARAISETDVSEEIRNLDEPLGFRDLELGDLVRKSGRTTETTSGRVTVVEALVNVSYGSDGVAPFQDQFVIESENGGPFSKGGDSGSVIMTEDGFIGGLLFAGSATDTIANRISNVISLLGIRL